MSSSLPLRLRISPILTLSLTGPDLSCHIYSLSKCRICIFGLYTSSPGIFPSPSSLRVLITFRLPITLTDANLRINIPIITPCTSFHPPGQPILFMHTRNQRPSPTRPSLMVQLPHAFMILTLDLFLFQAQTGLDPP